MAKQVVTVRFEFDDGEPNSSENAQSVAEFVVNQVLTGKRKAATKFTKSRNMSMQVLSDTMRFEPIK